MQVPLLDLKAQYIKIKDEVEAAINKVLESQSFIMGAQVLSLEKKIASYVSCRHAVAVASGSDALLISLMASNVKPGDAVITTPYTFFATVGAISRLGAIPVFVDIDERTYNLDPNKIEGVFNKKGVYASRINFHLSRIKAVLPVHLYGQSVNMDPVMEIAKKYNLIIIEDAAQAIGTEYKGRRVGSIGNFGCFSFYPSKNLGAFGDGGIIATNDDEYAERMRVLRFHGSEPKYYHKYIGMNSRLDTIQAAILEVKLNYLDRWSEARKENAEWYNKKFYDFGLTDRFVVTPYSEGWRHIYNQYVIRCKNRNGLMKYLRDNGIGCEVYYPVPLHLQECFRSFNYGPGDFPVSETAANETVAIPVYPELTLEQKEFVVEVIRKFYSCAENQYAQ